MKKGNLKFVEHPTDPRFKDFTGRVYGRLTVLGHAGKEKGKSRYWYCECSCGTIKKVSNNSLTNGNSSSCGCYRRDIISKRNFKHGYSKRGQISPTFRCWLSMIERCTSESHEFYHHYGGRGIKVCERWGEFLNFLEDMGEKPYKLSLDRINNNDGYYPDNCRWATKREQSNNTRSNHLITIDGEELTVSQWGRKFGIHKDTILSRLKRGWSEKDSVVLPVVGKHFRYASK